MPPDHTDIVLEWQEIKLHPFIGRGFIVELSYAKARSDIVCATKFSNVLLLTLHFVIPKIALPTTFSCCVRYFGVWVFSLEANFEFFYWNLFIIWLVILFSLASVRRTNMSSNIELLSDDNNEYASTEGDISSALQQPIKLSLLPSIWNCMYIVKC